MPDGPRLRQLNLVVHDMDATVAFYRMLGIEIPDTMPDWQSHHRTAPMPDGIELELDSEASTRTWSTGLRPGTAVIGFDVPSRDDVDRLHATLAAAGYASVQAPYDAFWGSRYAIVNDPNGNAVGIMSPMDDAYRSAPPAP
jgi:uncharacterized glyoxalase superfamily protein PhnB